jgi:copper chaperone CopZ
MIGMKIPRPTAKIMVFAISLSWLPSSATYAAAPPSTEKIQIVANGMCCNGCAQKVAAQLYTAPGVSNVEADVPSHTVTVTFKPSARLTLGGLWQAAEKADGKPSKLVTSQATYTLQRPDQLQLKDPLVPGRYWVVVQQLATNDGAQVISKRLYAVRGVKNVSLDAANRTFFVESDANAALSPWSLLAAVEQSGLATESITGPQGVFTIERSAEKAARAYPAQQIQGAVR